MSKIDKRHLRYSEMRTIDDVQNERRKLRRLQRANEAHLREDWEDVKWELRPENLFDMAVGRLTCKWPLFGQIYAGVQTAIALFRGRRNERGCGCGADREYEQECGCN